MPKSNKQAIFAANVEKTENIVLNYLKLKKAHENQPFSKLIEALSNHNYTIEQCEAIESSIYQIYMEFEAIGIFNAEHNEGAED